MADKPADRTERQQIMALLESASEPVSVRDISKQAGLSEKEIIRHLEHIRRSLQQQKARLHLIPASCRACGFAFTKRQEVKKPSRCPVCRSEHLQPPLFYIETDLRRS